MSGLYFRGKLAYATHFARPGRGLPGALVIVPGRGMLSPDLRISCQDLRRIASVPVDLAEPRYRRPLERDARKLAKELRPTDEVVLLGSIASDKYVKPLREILEQRLRFPSEFIGRGDMSRGGLMLRLVRDDRPMTYIPVDGAPRRGKRPPRLPPRSAGFEVDARGNGSAG